MPEDGDGDDVAHPHDERRPLGRRWCEVRSDISYEQVEGRSWGVRRGRGIVEEGGRDGHGEGGSRRGRYWREYLREDDERVYRRGRKL